VASRFQQNRLKLAREELDAGKQAFAGKRYGGAVARFEAGLRCLEAIRREPPVQEIRGELQAQLAQASRAVEAAKAAAEAKRTQQEEAKRQRKMLEHEAAEESARIAKGAAALAATKRGGSDRSSAAAVETSARNSSSASPVRGGSAVAVKKVWLPERRKIAAAHVNSGRKAATAGKYSEASKHYDAAEEMLGGHVTLSRTEKSILRPGKPGQPVRSLREQAGLEFPRSPVPEPEPEPEPELVLEPERAARMNKPRAKKRGKRGKKGTAVSLSDGLRSKPPRTKRRRTMNTIPEEPPGFIGWLLGSSMAESDMVSLGDQMLGSDLCMMAGLVAAAGTLLSVTTSSARS
jgi:hypothetical protein